LTDELVAQVRRTLSEHDATSYAAASELYLWNPMTSEQSAAGQDSSAGSAQQEGRTGRWELFQRLGSEFESVVSSGASESASQIFCSPCPAPSEDDKTITVPYLRGATAMTAFHHHGEDYLAVAQSFDIDCPSTNISKAMCEDMVAQPKSAVLQFNRQTQRFGEVLAFPAAASPLRSAAPTDAWPVTTLQYIDTVALTQQALRIDAGRVSRFIYLPAGEDSFLVACSLSHGALVYQWQFHQSISLENVVSVMFAPAKAGSRQHILAAGRGSPAAGRLATSQKGGAITILQISEQYDDLGKQTRSCAGKETCLHQVGAIFEHVPSMNRSDATGERGAKSGSGEVAQQGLANAARIRLAQLLPAAQGGACSELSGDCLIQVSHEIARSEQPCSPMPLPASMHAPSVRDLAHWQPVHCQRLSFEVSLESTTNNALFQLAPQLDNAGMLTFELAPQQAGRATFAVKLIDDSANQLESATKLLEFNVVPVNLAPVFELAPSETFFIYQNGGTQSLVFAHQVAAPEAGQALEWLFDYSPPELLAAPPSLTVVRADNGEQQGVVSLTPMAGRKGSLHIRVRLKDDGPDHPIRGHVNVSPEAGFDVRILGINHAPVFSFAPTSILTDGVRGKEEQEWLQVRPGLLSLFSLPAGVPHIVTSLENGGDTVLAPFAVIESMGAPDETHQQHTFTITSIQAVESRWPLNGLFDWIYVNASGVLHMRTARHANGVFQVGLLLEDDGGTVGGGINASSHAFILIVMPINSHPEIQVPRAGLTAVCAGENASMVHLPGAVDIATSPLDEVNQSFTFDIVDITDPSLFVDPISALQIAPDGSVSVNCSAIQRRTGVTAVDIVLRDDGGSRPVLFAGALEPGLVWEEASLSEPTLKRQIRNEALEKALQLGEREFSPDELKAFGLSELTFGSYIAVEDIYFKPSTPVQQLICSSTAPVAPACQVSFSGLPSPPSNLYGMYPSQAAYNGVIVRVSVANTDFSEADEHVTAVWIGNERFSARPGGDHFMADGYDNRCTKMDKLIDMWLPLDSPAFERANETDGGASAGQELTVRIETSDAVGCCFCNGATLFAEVTLIPYTVPDDHSLRTTLDVWIVPQRRQPSIQIPLVLKAVEQERQPADAATFALLRVDDFVLSADSGVDDASDVLWNFTITVDLGGNTRLVPDHVTISAGSGRASAGATGASWSLLLPLGWGEIGNADLTVAASVVVSRGERFEPQIFHMPAARKCSLRVRPRPVLMSVGPCVGAVQGGTLVTLHGFHLKLYSPSDTIRVWFGERECRNVSLLVSSNGAAATCITPPAHHIWQRQAGADMPADTMPVSGAAPFAQDAAGRALQGSGLVNVSIAFVDTPGNSTERNVEERLRQATLANGFRYWLLLMATTARTTSSGLLSALSPHNLAGPISSFAYSNVSSGPLNGNSSLPSSEQRLDYFPAANATNMWNTGLQTSSAISAVAVWRHHIIVAGTFSRVEVPLHPELADKTHHIAVFDGRAPSALGLGLNGPVHTLASFAGKLVVGGAFARAFQASSSPLHVKGSCLA